MSDTPETDAAELIYDGIVASGYADVDVCRKLERERDDAREALRILFKDYKELADSGDAGFWELEDKDAAQPALRILQQMEDATPTTKHEQVSSKLARYKEDDEFVTEQRAFRRLVEAIVTTDMTADTLLEVRRLFGAEIDAAVDLRHQLAAALCKAAKLRAALQSVMDWNPKPEYWERPDTVARFEADMARARKVLEETE